MAIENYFVKRDFRSNRNNVFQQRSMGAWLKRMRITRIKLLG